MSKEKVIDISTRKTGKIVGICAAAVAAVNSGRILRVHSFRQAVTGVVTTFGKVSEHCTQRMDCNLKVPFAQRDNNSVKQDTSLSG